MAYNDHYFEIILETCPASICKTGYDLAYIHTDESVPKTCDNLRYVKWRIFEHAKHS